MEEQYNVEKLMELTEKRQFRELKNQLIELNEADIAEFLEELPQEKSVVVFRMLPKDQAADVFAFLPPEAQGQIINGITDTELKNIVEDLYVDDAVDMLEELPATVVRRVLQNAAPDTRQLINQFLNYPENSAGTIMTAEYIGLKKDMTVEQSFDYIRKNGVDKETIYICYVTDAQRHLEGVVTVRDLLMHSYETVIGTIMDDNVIKAVTTDDREDVVDTFNKYDLIALPVVDHENRLVGIVTVDDAVDVMEQEATEDIEKMAAMVPSDQPYLKQKVWVMARNRIGWLLVLMVSSMITGGILAHYEQAFAALPLLVTFIPMLTDTGGNAGSQSSTSIIRGMTLGEIQLRDLPRVVWKETRISLLCGTALGLVNFIRLMIVYPGQLMICLTVVLSLFVTVLLAQVIGCILPLIAEKLHLDPAIMAAPLITTIVDAVSLVVYFQIACSLLSEIS